MYRSLLYVPATNARFVDKAAERGADAIILDLEDSIPLDQKANARAALAAAAPQCRRHGADVAVRVNRPIRHCIADVSAAVAAGADVILLPKAESAGHVKLIAEAIEDAEREFGAKQIVKMIVLLEDPPAVFDAQAIIAASPRVIGAATGSEDIATVLEAEPLPETLRMAKQMVHMAAKGTGRFSFGLFGTVADYSDKDAIRALVAEARRHGFDGASCIHPSVVELLNDGFSPSEAEVAHARRVIDALDKAKAQGLGAVSLDGKMIDKPVADRARLLLTRAGRSG
ncbi:MAG: CoA ester lyase [Alphaproteobacteria bacterium]|nr:CoA ester lyase [Alphaproteobacteria bacterium]